MEAPRDPFADDPDDPAREMAALDEAVVEPMLPADREQVLSDLEDLEVFDALLSPRGVRGLVTGCEGCGDLRCWTWDLLRVNLRSLLDAGTTPAHEPAFAPDTSEYVSWDYARGYADAALEG